MIHREFTVGFNYGALYARHRGLNALDASLRQAVVDVHGGLFLPKESRRKRHDVFAGRAKVVPSFARTDPHTGRELPRATQETFLGNLAKDGLNRLVLIARTLGEEGLAPITTHQNGDEDTRLKPAASLDNLVAMHTLTTGAAPTLAKHPFSLLRHSDGRIYGAFFHQEGKPENVILRVELRPPKPTFRATPVPRAKTRRPR